MAINISINLTGFTDDADGETRGLYLSSANKLAIRTRFDPEPKNTPMKGPLLAALLFAAFRSKGNCPDDTSPELDIVALNAFRDKFDFLGSDGLMKNGLDQIQAFLDSNHNAMDTLAAMQTVYCQFLAFGTQNGLWGADCRAKYTQLARIAFLDWKDLQTAPWD